MYAVISLILCLVVIVLGFFTKKNIGAIAIGIALILGHIAGVSDNEIIANFPLSLFINLSGIFFLFAIAECNEVIQLTAKKLLLKLPRSRRAFPILVFFVCGMLACIDAGSYAIFTFTPMITMSIGLYLGLDIIMVGIMTIYGAALAMYTPISAMGSAMAGIAAGSGYTGISWPVFFAAVFLYTILALFTYVIFKGYKGREKHYGMDTYKIDFDEEVPPFNRNQKIILAAIAILIIVVMITGINPGLMGFLVGCILLIANTADEKEVFKAMPWNLIIMITGFGLLIGLTKFLGGVDLLAGWLAGFVNKYIAAPVLGLSSSIMSLFTLAIAGPIPALTPTLAAVSDAVDGMVSEFELLLSVYCNSMATTISPLSLGGAIILSSYNTIMNPTPAESNRVFNKLLLLALLSACVAALIAGTGVYGLFER